MLEERAKQHNIVRIDLPGDDGYCELVPIVDATATKDAGVMPMTDKSADALRSNPFVTCHLYNEFKGGSSLCALGSRLEANNTTFLTRDQGCRTRRTARCKSYEIKEE